MAQTVRLAIMGAGTIARSVYGAIASAEGCSLVAVASRSRERAADLASKVGDACEALSYDDLLSHPAIDAVYLATPNAFHVEHCAALLSAGKHVLCEKPMAWRERDALDLFRIAGEQGVTLMEVFHYLHHPQVEFLRSILAGESAIGRVTAVECAFETDLRGGPTAATRFSKRLAGGALLDVGVYPMSMLRAIGGDLTVHAASRTTHDPIDGESQGVDGSGRAEGQLQCGTPFRAWWAIDANKGTRCVLHGEHGTATVLDPFHPKPDRCPIVFEVNGSRTEHTIEHGGPRVQTMFERFARAVHGGEPLPTRDFTLAHTRTVERIAQLADLELS